MGSFTGNAAATADGPDAPTPSATTVVDGHGLLAWRRRLLARGGAAAGLDWLLDLAAGLSWRQLQSLWIRPSAEVTLQCSLEAMERLWLRHLTSHEPLQYLVGLCPWRDLELPVAPGVLIPRQETELLVDLALQLLPPPRADLLWADLGTGSGCLAIALARALPGSRGLAADASAEALRQAEANLQRWGLREQVTVIATDWWQGLRPWWGQLDLVVANPPYIPTATVATLDPVVRDHEPTLALDGGPDGLTAIRRILAGARQGLAPGGLLLLEHHHDQGDRIADLLAEAGLERQGAHRDLEGQVRFASAWCPAAP